MIGNVAVRVKDIVLNCVYEYEDTFDVYQVTMCDIDITTLVKQLNIKQKINKLALDALGGPEMLIARASNAIVH